jgi:hypothetical protein
MPSTVYGVLSWEPFLVSFAGAAGAGFCVGLGDGVVAGADGVGVDDGVRAAGVVVAGALKGSGDATGLAVQAVRASTAASASVMLRRVTAGRAR